MDTDKDWENYTITPEQAGQKAYRAALRDEINTGVMANAEVLKNIRINHPAILAYKKKAMGQTAPVKDYADWAHFLLTDYGPHERCLSLGSGIGRIEKYLVDIGFTEKMETYELCADANESIQLKDPKIATLAADLNFTDLQANSYDFILCHGVLHHLINLEHVLYMINRALKSDGIFVVYEYIGENRWQFTEQRFHFLKQHFPVVKFRPFVVAEVGGFESIRSGELLNLIQNQFGNTCKYSVSYGGVYFPFVTCTAPAADAQIEKVVALDEKVTKEGILPPCYHLGIYGKSDMLPIPAKRWTNEELNSRLPSLPLKNKIKQALIHSPAGPSLKWVKKSLQTFYNRF